MKNFLKKVAVIASILVAVNIGAQAATTIWGSTHRSVSVTNRIPVDTSSSSGPGYNSTADVVDTVHGDCTSSAAAIVCTKSNGVNFGPFATLAAPALDNLSDAISVPGSNTLYLGTYSGVSATGTFNTSVGVGALAGVTSDSGITAIGAQALGNTTAGAHNTAVGQIALANSTGLYNTAVGSGAGSNMSSGSQCTFLGKDADTTDGTVINAMALGYGVHVTTTNTVKIGNNAVADVYFGDGSNTKLHGDGSMLTHLPSGATDIDGLSDAATSYPDSNMYLGQGDGDAATGNSFTTVLGAGAVQGALTGNFNTVVGAGAMAAGTGAHQNTVMGANAMASATSGNSSVAIGDGALSSVVGGSANVAIGSGAGASVTGQRTILIGRNASTYTPSAVDIIAIGDNVTGGAERTWVVGGPGMTQAIYEGSNAAQGQDTLVAGTVTVSNNRVTANSRIHLTCNDPNGGTPGAEYISARSPGTSFDITSTSGADTCMVAWEIKEPN